MKKYWYKFYTSECPVCGSGDTSKSREYGEKPEDWNARHEFTEYYDYCLE